MNKIISKSIAFLVLGAGIASCNQYKTESQRPNILFILTDDQAPFTLKAYGNQVCQTPYIDELAAEGMTLDAAYHMGSWMSAVCIPSRTQIMTGRHLWRTLSLRSLPLPNYPNPAEANVALKQEDPEFYSIPAVFNRAGYITFRTCKRGNSYNHANRLFTYNYEKTCVYADDENGSKWHGDKVIAFLGMMESQEQKQPFLIYFGFSHPHDPRYGKKEFYEKYRAFDEPPSVPNPKSPPLSVNYLPKHPFRHGTDESRDEATVQGVMTRRDEATVRNEIGREYATIENIDVQIGRVLKKLKEMGELGNTYIFFTSDHGIAVGRHGLMGKQNLYEHSWRVPLIVKGPGIKPGSRALGNTYLMDVLPTMCDMAGIEIPETCDGKSFLPVLKGKTKSIRDLLYGAFTIHDVTLGDPRAGSRPGIRAVRNGDWKLIKYDVYNGKVQKTQLFNLKENPDELLIDHHESSVIHMTGNKPNPNQVNLANDPKYDNKLKEMEDLLVQQQIKYNDPYHLWDQSW